MTTYVRKRTAGVEAVLKALGVKDAKPMPGGVPFSIMITEEETPKKKGKAKGKK